jgi:hypothetical protein
VWRAGLGEKKVQRLWEAIHEPFFRKQGAAPGSSSSSSSAGAAAGAGGEGGGAVMRAVDALEYGSGDDPDGAADEED